MLSKSIIRATALGAAFCALSCAAITEAPQDTTEMNLAFTLEQNLIALQTVRIDGRPGRYILATAAPNIVLDDEFQTPGRTIQFGERATLPIRAERLDLRGVADGLIGSSAWPRETVTIDYRTGLVTIHTGGIERAMMTVFSYRQEPAVEVQVDGQTIEAIVDSANPDTLILPGDADRRGTARVVLGGIDFGTIDIRYAPVRRARVGNRLLSSFLVSIDYGNRLVGLWIRG